MKEIDLNPWLTRMSQGDEAAFHVVYELTCDYAHGLIYYLTPNKQDVGDIMTTIYRLGTDSLNITKEQLVEAAKSI